MWITVYNARGKFKSFFCCLSTRHAWTSDTCGGFTCYHNVLLSRTFSRSIDAIYLSMEAINHAPH